MAIRLHKPRIKGSTPASHIKENIRLGLEIASIYENAKYYSDLRAKHAIGTTIRDCNGTLGMTGKIKNGCLYREFGLSEFWKKGNGEVVVCDHAVPVTELVRRYREEDECIEKLIFSPVVRITKKSDIKLVKAGLGKKGHKTGLPLFRYSEIKMRIVTHKGVEIEPEKWTDEDHWDLVESTEELSPVWKELFSNLNNS